MVPTDFEFGLKNWQGAGTHLGLCSTPLPPLYHRCLDSNSKTQHPQLASYGNASAISHDWAGSWWCDCTLSVGYSWVSGSCCVQLEAQSSQNAWGRSPQIPCSQRRHTDPFCSSCTCMSGMCSHCSELTPSIDHHGREEMRLWSCQPTWSYPLHYWKHRISTMSNVGVTLDSCLSLKQWPELPGQTQHTCLDMHWRRRHSINTQTYFNNKSHQ